MINQLPAGCLAVICSFLPLLDKWSDDVPFRFISNIGIEDEDVGLFVLALLQHTRELARESDNTSAGTFRLTRFTYDSAMARWDMSL